MTREILTDRGEIDYVEVSSSNVSESTVGEVTTATLTDDMGNSYILPFGTKIFNRDGSRWYSSNGDGTALYLFDMG